MHLKTNQHARTASWREQHGRPARSSDHYLQCMELGPQTRSRRLLASACCLFIESLKCFINIRTKRKRARARNAPHDENVAHFFRMADGGALRSSCCAGADGRRNARTLKLVTYRGHTGRTFYGILIQCDSCNARPRKMMRSLLCKPNCVRECVCRAITPKRASSG